jgi:hypothetical protein
VCARCYANADPADADGHSDADTTDADADEHADADTTDPDTNSTRSATSL